MANATDVVSTSVPVNTTDGSDVYGAHGLGLPAFPPDPIYPFILKTLLCSTVLLVTLIGNVLVLVSFATTKKLRTYTNYYIVGLATADLVSGVIAPLLLNVPWLIGYWPFGRTVCRTFVYINIVFVHATFLLTFIICLDRYRAMSMPLKHLQEKNTKHALKMMLPGYLIPAVIWAVTVIILPEYGYFRPIPPHLCHLPYVSNRIILLVSTLIISWFPIIGTSALYSVIYFRFIRKSVQNKTKRARNIRDANSKSQVEVSKSNLDVQAPDYTNHAFRSEGGDSESALRVSRGIGNDAFENSDADSKQASEQNQRRRPNIGGTVPVNLPSSHHQKRQTSSRRATRTLAYIIVVMVICGTPWSVYSVLVTIAPSFRANSILQWAIGFMVHISSATNPLCYAACNPLFKEAFHRILCSMCGRRRRPSRRKDRT